MDEPVSTASEQTASDTGTTETGTTSSGTTGPGTTSTGTTGTGTGTGTTSTGTTGTTGTTSTPRLVWSELPVPCAEPSARTLQAFDHASIVASSVASEFAMQAGGLAAIDLDEDPELELLRATDTVVERYDLRPDGAWEVTGFLPVTPRVWMGISAADMDGDRDLDLLLLGFDAPKALLRNDGEDGFVDVTDGSGLQVDAVRSSNAAWADWDGDGILDLVVGNYGGPPVVAENAHPSELYRGRGDGTFEDVSHMLPAQLSESYTFQMSWFDIDEDGRPDLIAANDYPSVNQSVLVLNEADHFELVDGSGFAAGLDGMGIAMADISGDGLPEMVVTSIFEFGYYESFIAPEKPAGLIYFDRASELRLSPGERPFSWGVLFGDLDNDADEDLYMVFGDWEALSGIEDEAVPLADSVWMQSAPDTWVDSAEELGLADDGTGRGLAVVDLDRDGWLDAVVNVMEGRTAVHTARCGAEAWLTLRLQDEQTANTHALGATVDVTHEGVRQRRWIQAGSTSMFSVQQPEIHVGLGDVEVVDRIDVWWPDGEHTVREKVPTRRHLTLLRRAQ